MQSTIRYSSFVLVFALLLCLGTLSSAQQIRFEDFSNTNYANQHLYQNYSQPFSNPACGSESNLPCLATYQGNSVLRLTEGAPTGTEASTVYFNVEQQLTAGFTTWFKFQTHNPTACCSPGDGVAFIIQNSSATDITQGATGSGIGALGAGGNTAYPNQAGAMGYSGINNSLVVEFDISQNAWDPNANHIAVQTCGPPQEGQPNYNSPVHLSGNYTIGNNNQVTSCLYNQSQQSISTTIPMIAGTCMAPLVCSDGATHQVVIQYTPAPPGQQSGTLQVWFDPPFIPGTHIPVPGTPPTISVPLTIENVINLDTTNCPPQTQCSAWVGFTASQPSGSTAQDIQGWDFSSNQIQQLVPPGGIENLFDFGPHQTGVTYPSKFMPPSGLKMTVLATPVDRYVFYQTRLLGTNFANEQCIVYQGAGGTLQYASGNCVVYTVTCQQNGQDVTCPRQDDCSSDPTQCILVNTSFSTLDPVTPNNADYLTNDPNGDNMWTSIFTMYENKPVDGTTTGGTKGFGGGGSGEPHRLTRKVMSPQAGSADLVATFCPSQSGGGASGSNCIPLDRAGKPAADAKVGK